MSSSPQLQVSALNKQFAGRPILIDVDLTLHRGKAYLLSGANGAGKTTLLRIIAGLEKPDSSRFDLGQGPMKWRHCRSALQSKTLYLHQHPYMFDGSVRYNLGYALPRGLTRELRNERIDKALEWAELNSYAKTPAKTLSSGECQRISLARAWLKRPDMLLLDEPTANLDQESRQRTLDLLVALKQDGISLLVASHDPAHLSTLVDSHIHLDNGKTICLEHQEQIPRGNSKITPIRRIKA